MTSLPRGAGSDAAHAAGQSIAEQRQDDDRFAAREDLEFIRFPITDGLVARDDAVLELARGLLDRMRKGHHDRWSETDRRGVIKRRGQDKSKKIKN